MTSFLTVIATPAVQQVGEKSLFGKPQVRIGRLFSVIGYWVFQEGGVLGYFLRDNPVLLGKLAFQSQNNNINETDAAEIFKKLSNNIALHLSDVENEEKTFFNLYTLREFRNIGIDILCWPPDKKLDSKADAEFAGGVMRYSYFEGIGFGFNFPEQFVIYWENTYRMRPDNEWEEMRKRGLVHSEVEPRRTLRESIVEIGEAAISWASEQASGILNNKDIENLQQLVIENKEKKKQSRA